MGLEVSEVKNHRKQNKKTRLSLSHALVRGQTEGHICSICKFLSTNLRLSFGPKLLIAYVISLHADSPEVRFVVFFCDQRWDLWIA